LTFFRRTSTTVLDRNFLLQLDIIYGQIVFSDKSCFVCFVVVDKLLEMTDSMHRLMQEKRRLIASLLQIPYNDYENVAEVCNANDNCWLS